MGVLGAEKGQKRLPTVLDVGGGGGGGMMTGRTVRRAARITGFICFLEHGYELISDIKEEENTILVGGQWKSATR
jgi:hypothetical protein